MRKLLLICFLTLSSLMLISCANEAKNEAKEDTGIDDGYPELPSEKVDGKLFWFDPSQKYATSSGGIHYLKYSNKEQDRSSTEIFYKSSYSELTEDRYGFGFYTIDSASFESLIKQAGFTDCDKLYEELYKTLYFQAIKKLRENTQEQHQAGVKIAQGILDAFKSRKILFWFYNSNNEAFYDPQCSIAE